MDWKKETIDELRRHGDRRYAIGSIRERVDLLEADYGRLRAAQTDRDPVQGGGSSMEDRLINNIVERDRLLDSLQINEGLLRWMDAAIAGLDEDEKCVVEYFYIDRPEDYMAQLCERLGLERSQIYQLKERAVRHLAMRLYGFNAS